MQVLQVFAKYWLQQPEKIMAQIVKRIKEERVVEIKVVEIITHPADNQEPGISDEPGTIRSSPAETVLPGFENVQFERLVFNDAVSNKFWEPGVQSNQLIVRYGKLDTKGQAQVKTFAGQMEAAKEKEKMLREKKAKGYQDVPG